MKQEKIDILRLIRSENVGPKNFYNLINFFGNASKALEKIGDMSLKGGRSKPIEIASEKNILEEINNVTNYGAKIITYQDSHYPKLLKHIADPPPVITILGDEKKLGSKIFAIVGARNASANSCYFTEKIAKELGQAGLVIASGLAKGIDGFAHKASLKYGTIAVIAGGINNIYPPENEVLYHAIASEGCIIAESRFGAIPRAQNFPQRNRIISGISLGVLVIEATSLSGSLITARFASEQNREIFAVPGSPLDPRCSGNNKLLKEGAKLVTSVEDILEEINNFVPIFKESSFENKFYAKNIDLNDKEIDMMRKKLLEALDYTPISIEYLLKTTKISIDILSMLIVELELANRVERHAGNKISLSYSYTELI